MNRKRIFVTVALLALLTVFSAFGHRASLALTPPPAPTSVHLTLGNPSDATGRDQNNLLTIKPQYALSYNRAKGGPNWVSWHLSAADVGNSGRCNCFAPDTTLLPALQIRPNDYRGSGYDRGHMCPSADRSSTPANNTVTFLMSNMLPQTGDLNRHVWEKLEAYSRSLVEDGDDELYIIAGGFGEAGRIGGGKVNVPTNCWKIIVDLTEGDRDLSRIDADTRVIAVNMPNADDIESDPWQKYITTVDELETKTGYHFFTKLPASVQTALKAKRDPGRRARR